MPKKMCRKLGEIMEFIRDVIRGKFTTELQNSTFQASFPPTSRGSTKKYIHVFCISLIFEQESKGMQDQENPFQHVFTVEGCGMTEFNGKYFVDTAHENGLVNGKRCYRRDGSSDGGSECTIWFKSNLWSMGKYYGSKYYFVISGADIPPTSGWKKTSSGSVPPPQLVYGESDVPNFYFFVWFNVFLKGYLFLAIPFS